MKEVKYEERTGETKEENRSRAEGVVMRGPACITLLHCKSGCVFFYTWIGLQSGRNYLAHPRGEPLETFHTYNIRTSSHSAALP